MRLVRSSVGCTTNTSESEFSVHTTVNRAHMAYDHGGLKALKSQPSGGRKRENMTLTEEKVLLARFAKAAGAGEMLNIDDLKAAYETAIGHPTSHNTI